MRYGLSPDTLGPRSAGTFGTGAEARAGSAPGACDAVSAAIAAAVIAVALTPRALCPATFVSPPRGLLS
ncbi:hypothetical protein GCM10027074_29340 [Streptomyces deserti]